MTQSFLTALLFLPFHITFLLLGFHCACRSGSFTQGAMISPPGTSGSRPTTMTMMTMMTSEARFAAPDIRHILPRVSPRPTKKTAAFNCQSSYLHLSSTPPPTYTLHLPIQTAFLFRHSSNDGAAPRGSSSQPNPGAYHSHPGKYDSRITDGPERKKQRIGFAALEFLRGMQE